jgi:iodotyrosine deiodinase
MVEKGFVPLAWTELPLVEMAERSRSIYEQMNKRRTTRHFSVRDVPRQLIEHAIL